MDRLNAWRSEILAEIGELEAEQAALAVALTEAKAKVADELTGFQEFMRLLELRHDPEQVAQAPLPTAIANRLPGEQEALKAAQSRAGGIEARLKNCAYRLEDRREAIADIDRIIARTLPPIKDDGENGERTSA